MADFQWCEDTQNNPFHLEPYSEWLYYSGRDFDFAAEVPDRVGEFEWIVSSELFTGPVPAATTGVLPIFTLDQPGSGQPGDPDQTWRYCLFDPAAGTSWAPPAGAHQATCARVPLRSKTVPRIPKPEDAANAPLVWDFGDLSGQADWDPAKLVVVGVIDDAINLGHARFRRGATGSRVDYGWVQDSKAPAGAGNGTDFVPFGRELTRAEIEAAQTATQGQGDDVLLRELGLVDFSKTGHNTLARRASHGTHVMDLATGAAADRADINRRIVTVQIPALATLDTSGALLALFAVSGLRFILARARAMSRALAMPVPAVVNFSYGLAGGPHDGTRPSSR